MTGKSSKKCLFVRNIDFRISKVVNRNVLPYHLVDRHHVALSTSDHQFRTQALVAGVAVTTPNRLLVSSRYDSGLTHRLKQFR